MASRSSNTPVMQQYHAAKREYPDALLLFRLGDFFELFFDDAVVASQDLEITLTKRRDTRQGAIPMCGVPAHSVDGYLARLLQKGHRVAICDQVESSKTARKLVKREIVRVLSPGTASDPSILEAGENNYLAAVHPEGTSSGLAYVDVSTGEFRVFELPSAEVEEMLESLAVKEVLRAPPLLDSVESPDGHRYTTTEIESWVLDAGFTERLLLETFGLHNLDGLGIASRSRCISAAGAIVHYLKETQRTALPHLDPPTLLEQKDWMVLDPATVRHLEIFDSLYQETRSTLLGSVDRTSTPMGARLQRNWILRPSLDRVEIERRLDAVGTLFRDTIVRSELRGELDKFYDIERLLSRITLGSAGPRDVRNLGLSLYRIPALHELAAGLRGDTLSEVLLRMDRLEDVWDRIARTVAEEAPATLGDGTAIAPGFSSEFDELRAIRHDSREFIARLERRERTATGIESLKVRHNNIFGFFIEVSRPNLPKVPPHYERKQTLVNAERFVTAELKELEAKVLDAEERMSAMEAAIFEQLRLEIVGQARRIRQAAVAVAELDVLRGLAQVAVEHDYVRPEFSTGGEIQIEGGRHPVVERVLGHTSGDRFIENDTYLDRGERLLAIITGPNMGGKSTYLRQTALISVLAQSGSFVPASRARLPLVDRIFTRIGASDNLSLGRSTFMVEMVETAQILNAATEHSLILLDEIGRGTATYDGLAIAWAVAEHILAKVRAKTLFATHYHELTSLADARDGMFNLHVSARQAGDKLVFLRRIELGKADKSYGIEVARLAGLPRTVLARASEVLADHERREAVVPKDRAASDTRQGTIFGALPDGIVEELRCLDIDHLSPFEALSLVHEWKSALEQ